MNDIPIEVGRIVKSRCGRDKGKFFVVYKIVDEEYVYLIDGELRKIANPKLKKRKHLDLTKDVHEGLRDKIEQNMRIFDAEVRSCLKNMGYMPHLQRVLKEG